MADGAVLTNIKSEDVGNSKENSPTNGNGETKYREDRKRRGDNKHFDDAKKSRSRSRSRSPHDDSFTPGEFERETDALTLQRRSKQIEYGKNTQEYKNYATAIPKADREAFHPRTPNKQRKYSRRAWDGLVRQWRLNLHLWSTNSTNDPELKLGESATGSECGDFNLNDSFASADTGSTSSSISAAFNGIVMEVKVKKEEEPKAEVNMKAEEEDLDATLTNQSSSWAEEVEEEYYSSGGEAEGKLNS